MHRQREKEIELDAKSFLREIRAERREIRILAEKIREKEYELLPGAIRYDIPRVQTSPKDDMADKVSDISRYEKALRKHIRMLEQRQTKAVDMIRRIPSSDQRQVMESYYLSQDNPTWDDVADRLIYSRRSVLDLHGKALLWLNQNTSIFKK